MVDSGQGLSSDEILARLQESGVNPLTALQIEVARMSGGITATIESHRQQLVELKQVAETARNEAHTAVTKVENIANRLDTSRGTVLQVLGPMISLAGIIAVVIMDLIRH